MTRNGVIFSPPRKPTTASSSVCPYIYNYVEPRQHGAAPIRCKSLSGTVSMTVWMSKQGLFAFDGTSITPMNCMVRPWVDDDIDLLEVREQVVPGNCHHRRLLVQRSGGSFLRTG